MQYCGHILTSKLTRRKNGVPTNEAHVGFLAATLDAKLNGYEAILSKQKYVAGNVGPNKFALLEL